MLSRTLCVLSFILAVSAAEMGRLEIRFEKAEANKDINGDRCDNCFLCQNPCDAYIIVKVDGVEQYRTSVVPDSYSPTFDSTFLSGQISDDANISIEMLDSDDGDSEDDLMGRWDNLRIERLLNQNHWANDYNSIDVVTKWLKN